MTFDADRRAAWLIAAWWAAIAAALIAVRPATIVDETRYLSVAWEMFRSGDWLLLRLNGDLYGHKPPLLFWLIVLGWKAFGVSLWWPRLVTAAFGLGAVFVAMALTRRVAGDRPEAAPLAGLITGSALVWIAFAGSVMFDLPLAFFVLVALLLIVRASQEEGLAAWAGAGVALGLGVLTKGPVVFLHVLPAALLGPWWIARGQTAAPTSTGRWYGCLGVAMLVSAAVALAWVVPAAIVGGEAFRTEILWRQSAGRIATEDYHGRPFWYHAVVLPVLLLPWTVFPPFWRGLVAALRGPWPATTRFALAWFVPVFVAFSAIRGKQLQYLLPEVPALALLATAGVTSRAMNLRRTLALARWVGTGAVALFVALYLTAGPRLLPKYDLRGFAVEVARAQQRGQPVAHFGKYHGEYAFLGRLEQPLAVLQTPEAVLQWAQRHPDGAIVVRTPDPVAGIQPLATRAYRSDTVSLVRSADVPALGKSWYR